MSQVTDLVRKPVIGPPTISGTMPVTEVFSHLIRHGCNDVTKKLDFSSIGEVPVALGGYGEVFSGRLLDGTKVALKILRPGFEDDGMRENLRAAHELYVWSRVDHPNILPLIGAAILRARITLISPWMERGDLRYWRRHNPPAKPDCLSICVQIAEGLSYLHNTGIIHGDIKGANILMSEEMTPKICDFRGATFLNPHHELSFNDETNRAASPRWAAPELLLEESNPTIKSDVYALGMTILETITGEVPWPELKMEVLVLRELYQKSHHKRPQLHFPLEDEQANLTWDLLTGCWAEKPADRPTAAEVRDRLKDILAREEGPSTMVAQSPDRSSGSEIKKVGKWWGRFLGKK